MYQYESNAYVSRRVADVERSVNSVKQNLRIAAVILSIDNRYNLGEDSESLFLNVTFNVC